MAANLSILIITYNRPEDTLDLLKNMSQQEDYSESVGEVLLLNNNSSTSYHIVDEFIAEHPEMRINFINHSENLGVARGRNFLIQQAKFPYLLVLDDDVLFDTTTAFKQANYLFEEELFAQNNVAVIMLNVFYHATKERQKSAFPHKKFEKYKDQHQFLTYYFIGAAHLMRRELFDKTGLYPEDFFYGVEEYDLSYRILENGYRLAYDDSIKVYHKESPAGRITNTQKLKMLWYNKSVVTWKFLPKKFFYTTTLLWSFFFLKQSNFKVITFFKTWKEIFAIRKKYTRKPIGQDALDYLQKTEARLWY